MRVDLTGSTLGQLIPSREYTARRRYGATSRALPTPRGRAPGPPAQPVEHLHLVRPDQPPDDRIVDEHPAGDPTQHAGPEVHDPGEPPHESGQQPAPPDDDRDGEADAEHAQH